MSPAGAVPRVPSLTDRVRTAVGMPSTTERALHRIVEELPVTPTDEVTDGLHAVRGTVAVDEGTVPEPLTTENCVYAQYEIRERGEQRGGEAGYEVVEGRVDAVPFRVEDDAGAVIVDPTGIEHVGGGRPGSPLDAAGPLPLSDAATRAFADSSGELEEVERERLGREETGAAWVHEEVHVQSTIRPGDAVYVLGEFQGGANGLPTVTPTGGPFLFSDMSPSALAATLERSAGDVSGQFLRFLAFGLIAVVVVLIVVGMAVAILVTVVG